MWLGTRSPPDAQGVAGERGWELEECGVHSLGECRAFSIENFISGKRATTSWACLSCKSSELPRKI